MYFCLLLQIYPSDLTLLLYLCFKTSLNGKSPHFITMASRVETRQIYYSEFLFTKMCTNFSKYSGKFQEIFCTFANLTDITKPFHV